MEPTRWSSTAVLIELAREGDRSALDRLLARHRTALLHAVRAISGPALAARIEPEDVFQEAAMQAMRSIASLRARDAAGFRRWFQGIARHRILVHVAAARPRTRPRKTTALPDAHLSFQDPALVPDAEFVEAQDGLEDTGRRESRGLDGLLPDGRMAVVLHGVFESHWKTIAFLLDRATNEAARQVHLRARTRLGHA